MKKIKHDLVNEALRQSKGKCEDLLGFSVSNITTVRYGDLFLLETYNM